MLNEGQVKLLLLCPIYLIYMMIGAAIFMGLEQKNEKNLLRNFNEIFEEFYSTRNVSKSTMNDLSKIYMDALSSGINPLQLDHLTKWDFAGSFYFVGTVLTTIGFGLTAPITIPGQVCLVLYAFLGIPLNLLLFNTLLDQTVNIFTNALCRLNRCFKRKLTSNPWEPTAITITLAGFIVIVILILLAAPLFCVLEDWSFFESIYFLVVAFTTIGFGDYVPSGGLTVRRLNHTIHYKVGNWLVIIIGTIFMYTSMALMASLYKQGIEYLIENYRKCFKKKSSNRITNSPVEAATPDNTQTTSPLQDERKRQMAVRALQNWRSVKSRNIGIVNQVEESILKTRRAVYNDSHLTTGVDSAHQFNNSCYLLSNSCYQLSNGCLMNNAIATQTTIDDLNSLEAKITNEFNQLIKDIEIKRGNLLKKTVSDERGIDNGVIIGVYSPDSTSGPIEPIDITDDRRSSSVILTAPSMNSKA